MIHFYKITRKEGGGVVGYFYPFDWGISQNYQRFGQFIIGCKTNFSFETNLLKSHRFMIKTDLFKLFRHLLPSILEYLFLYFLLKKTAC